ncbi:MAG: 4'-phosphopantetheinyl transferase family protein, partial [Legionellales bacterium]
MTITKLIPLATQNPTLDESHVDLWQFSLEHELNNAQQLLNADERTRGARFYFSRHRRRFCTARATMRIILARYLDCAPEDLEFTYNDYGKPDVINTKSLQFNISHSADLALLAVGMNHPMGVDIE